MKNQIRTLMWAACLSLAALPSAAQDKSDVMSPAYREMWNAEVQQKIDHDIETYRKADAVIKLDNVKPGTQVKVEQLTSDFLFGGNSFLFGQFDTPEKNKRYEDVFGDLFNAATIAFYWKTLEPEKGKPRFTADSPAIFRRPCIEGRHSLVPRLQGQLQALMDGQKG